MEEVYRQLLSLVLFIATGMVIGILFDIFRVLRKCFKTADFITYVQDILFWIFAGIITLFSIFQFNQGEIRVYIFLGIFIGILVYMITISKFIVKYSVILVKTIKKIISYPMQLIINFTKKWIITPTCNFIKQSKKNIYAKKERKKVKIEKNY